MGSGCIIIHALITTKILISNIEEMGHLDNRATSHY